MSTYGILLPCDGSEPMPIAVGDYKHIQTLVGGVFDCVTRNVEPSMFDDPEHEMIGVDAEPFTVCGYIHDEGLLLGLPVNAMASVMLEREIVGPCVVVSGTSPSGAYDGDNYDIPEWFANAVFQGGLYELSQTLHEEAEMQAKAMEFAFEEGLFTKEQFTRLIAMMASGDEMYDGVIMQAMNIATVYYMARQDGILEKFDRDEFVRFQGTLRLSDDEITRFWEEEGSK